MNLNISPVEVGLDAMGIHSPEDMLAQLGVHGGSPKIRVTQAIDRIKVAINDYPELRSEILVAGVYILLGEVDDIEEVRNTVIPMLDSALESTFMH